MSEHRKRPPDPEDDGQTIVDMNVDGMPWYMRSQNAQTPTDRPPEPLSREEARRYTWASVKAGLLIVLVFAVVFGLFIAFCDFIWFR